MVKQKVFWLQVSMNNSQLMNVLNARNNLLVHLGRLIFLEPSVLYNMLEQFASRAIFHDQIEIIVIFYHFVELYDMRVSHFLKDCDFSVNSVDVTLVLDFVFFEYFYCHFVACDNMGALFYFSEGSFTFGLANYETTNLLALTVLFLFTLFIIIFVLFIFDIFNFNFISLLILSSFGPIGLLAMRRDLSFLWLGICECHIWSFVNVIIIEFYY